MNKKPTKEQMLKAIKKHRQDIWIKAVFITIAILMTQALIGKWLVSLVGINLNIWTALSIAGIINLLVGFYNGFKLYAKKDSKKS